MNKNPLRRRRQGSSHYPYDKKPAAMCKWKYCYKPRGPHALCMEHRIYMRVAKAKAQLSKKYGISKKELCHDLVVLLTLIQMGSVKSHVKG